MGRVGKILPDTQRSQQPAARLSQPGKAPAPSQPHQHWDLSQSCPQKPCREPPAPKGLSAPRLLRFPSKHQLSERFPTRPPRRQPLAALRAWEAPPAAEGKQRQRKSHAEIRPSSAAAPCTGHPPGSAGFAEIHHPFARECFRDPPRGWLLPHLPPPSPAPCAAALLCRRKAMPCPPPCPPPARGTWSPGGGWPWRTEPRLCLLPSRGHRGHPGGSFPFLHKSGSRC